MAFHSERHIGFGFLILLCVVVALSMDGRSINLFQPPPGYGAAGDHWRGTRMPRIVQAAIEEQSAGSEASWVKECAEDGTWVYELHLLKDRKWFVIPITLNGEALPPRLETSNFRDPTRRRTSQ